MTEERDILQEIKACSTESKNSLQTFYDKMEKCHQYYNGKQWQSKDRSLIEKSGNMAPELNLIAKQIDSIIGRRLTTLTDLKAYEAEADDSYLATLSTNIMKFVFNDTNAQTLIAQAFKDQLLGGMGWLVVEHDTTKDPISGDASIKYERYSNVRFDPTTEDILGLSDCDYIERTKLVSKKELKKLFPDKADAIDSLKADTNSGSMDKHNVVSGNRNQKITVKEHWYKSTVKKTFIINKDDEEDKKEWLGKLKDRLTYFLSMNQNVMKVDVDVTVVRVATSANDSILLQDVETDYRRFPFVPFIGYFDGAEEEWEYRIKGYASQLIGLQDQILFFRGAILKSVRDFNNGNLLVIDEGAVKDVEDVRNKRGKGGILQKRKGSEIQYLQQNPIPQAYQGMELALRNDITVVGTPPEVIGNPSNLESGKAISLIQTVGLMHVGEINEHLNFALRLLGQIILEIAYQNFSPTKIRKICGNDFEINNDIITLAKETTRYDIRVDETTNSQTSQIAAWESLQGQIQHGIQVPYDTLVENNPYLTYDQKKKALQQYQETQQQQAALQQQQREHELAMQQVKSTASLQSNDQLIPTGGM